MINLTDVEGVRKGLELLCRNPLGRLNPPNIDVERHRWLPFTVMHPQLMSRFNDVAAWEFIADCLASNCPISCQPPDGEFNDHAYVMIETCGDRRIYMKIAIFPDIRKVIGISFHYEREC